MKMARISFPRGGKFSRLRTPTIGGFSKLTQNPLEEAASEMMPGLQSASGLTQAGNPQPLVSSAQVPGMNSPSMLARGFPRQRFASRQVGRNPFKANPFFGE